MVAIAFALPAHAQEPRGIARVELAGGAVQRGSFSPTSLRITSQDVSEARCRSCVGRHVSYSLDVRFERGALERVAIDADVVGGHQSFSTGNGPYPAWSMVRVWFRDGAEPATLSGRIELGGTRERWELTFTARGEARVRTMRFEVPRAP